MGEYPAILPQLHDDAAEAPHLKTLPQPELRLSVLEIGMPRQKSDQRRRGRAGTGVLANSHAGREHPGGEVCILLVGGFGEAVDGIVPQRESVPPSAAVELEPFENVRVANRYEVEHHAR